MGSFFAILVIKLLGWLLSAILFSFKISWRIIKAEASFVALCFRKYPIGFISFFFHFIGYFLAQIASILGKSFWIKLYTLGIADSMDAIMSFAGFPMKALDWCSKIGDLGGDGLGQDFFPTLIESFCTAWVMVPCFLLTVELYLFFFPLLSATFTQIILGIPFRGFVQRWRKRRLYGKDYVEPEYVHVVQIEPPSYDDSTYIQERSSRYQSMEQRHIADEYKNIESRTEIAPAKKALRKFNDAYQRAYDEVSKKTQDIKSVKDKLSARKGQVGSVERIFADLEDKQSELHDVYNETKETALYAVDEKEVLLAYDSLKKSIKMVKYTQDDLLQLMKNVYQ